MGRPRKNIFADAADARGAEQDKIERNITRPKEKAAPFKKLGREDKTATTVILSKVNHMAIKRCALENGTTFSEMINRWIEEKCADFLKK